MTTRYMATMIHNRRQKMKVGAAANEIVSRQMKYVIAWRSLVTGVTGRGSVSFEKTDLESYVEELNHTYSGVIEHWLEPDG